MSCLAACGARLFRKCLPGSGSQAAADAVQLQRARNQVSRAISIWHLFLSLDCSCPSARGRDTIMASHTSIQQDCNRFVDHRNIKFLKKDFRIYA